MAKEREQFGSGDRGWVSIDDMDRDEAVNPGYVDERRAEQIAALFDPDKFGEVTVSERANGRFVILDGQNRVHALRVMGWNGQKVPCRIFHGLNRAREAEIFLGLAVDRHHGHMDRFLARITLGDPVARAIKKIVSSAGYVIARFSRDGAIVATLALEDIYLGVGLKVRGHNPKALENTILAVTAAWGCTAQSVNGRVLRGIGAFFLRYGHAADVERVVAKLRGVPAGPKGIIQRGQGKREIHGGSIAFGIADYLTDEYNRGLRGSRRLPGWRESEEYE